MAKVTSVNNLPANGSEALYIFKQTMKAAGWTVPESSDGTTYNAGGDQISHGGSGAGGLSNNNAWFRLVDPDGEREFTFQRLGADTHWRVKYSALDGFVGGTPSASQTPSATDEQILLGGGTDASPSTDQLFSGTPGRFHVVARDDANARGVYGFWMWDMEPGQTNANTVFFCEPMDPNTIPPLVGTRAAPTTGDADPCVLLCGWFSNGGGFECHQGAGWASTGTPLRAWWCYNNTNGQTETWVSMGGASYVGDNSPFFALAGGQTANAGVNPYDGKDDALPIWCGRGTGGFSTMLGLKGATQFLRMQVVGRSYPDTVELASGAYIYVEQMLVPWEDGTTPLT